jgi:AraC-like DNA-binding protein
MVVKAELEKLGLRYLAVDLGVVELSEKITPDQRKQLEIALRKSGLELMEDQKAILIERIRLVVVEMVHYEDTFPRVNISDHISGKLGYDYTYLSNIFSEVQGITIQQFVILHKIERVKELLLYDELNLTEISYRLNYSSVSHLSRQFKKVTGLSPSYFKKLQRRRKKNLEDL